jgi:hypothetical protein
MKTRRRVREQAADIPHYREKLEEHVEATAFSHYEMTVAMLNKTLGLCLR